jgi:hypothetical protein
MTVGPRLGGQSDSLEPAALQFSQFEFVGLGTDQQEN